MDIKNRKALKDQAQKLLDRCDNAPRKLTLINSGVFLGLSLVISLITLALNRGIAGTGGLSGIQTRNILQTIQSVLNLVYTVTQPFWLIGLGYVYMQTVRKQTPQTQSLLRGFHRFGPVLRLLILEAVIYFAAVLVAAQVGSFVYMLSPASQPLVELTEQMMEAGSDAAMLEMLEALDNDAMMSILLGMLPYILIPALVIMIPLSYRLRLAQYVVMDEQRVGAFYALSQSLRLTRRRCLQLLRLDLRLWWYYALQVVVLAVCYGDMWLPLLGVTLDVSSEVASLAFYAVGLALQLGLHWWKMPQVMTAYAGFYDRLCPKRAENTI